MEDSREAISAIRKRSWRLGAAVRKATAEECAWECVAGSFKFLSFVIRAAPVDSYFTVHYLRSVIEWEAAKREREKERVGEGVEGERCAGG